MSRIASPWKRPFFAGIPRQVRCRGNNKNVAQSDLALLETCDRVGLGDLSPRGLVAVQPKLGKDVNTRYCTVQ